MKHATVELLTSLGIEPNTLNIECREQLDRFEILSELTGNSTPSYIGILGILSQYPLPERSVKEETLDESEFDAGQVGGEDELDAIFDGDDTPNELVDGKPANPQKKRRGRPRKLELVEA